jgi:eukaryotic-like serine/threonine-protein kinase
MSATILNGKYRLLRRIGEGAMGEVFEAEHVALRTRVAIKLLHPHLARRPGFVERVLREARAVARIDHPHVVRVLDVERYDEGAYLVMELVGGEPLDEILAARPETERAFDLREATRLMTQVLDGVAAAHRAGVVHRDLKPANILVMHDRHGAAFAKVLDFGIAKMRADAGYRTLTAPGDVLGTPGYMAPEQAFGTQAVDARADVFCLGVVFYELLSGRHPAEGVEPVAIPHFMAKRRQTPLGELVADLPEVIAAAIDRALAPDPADRFADAAEFRDAVAPSVPSEAPELGDALAPSVAPEGQRRLVPPTIPAAPPSLAPHDGDRENGGSPSTAPTALDPRDTRRRLVASAIGAGLAALMIALLVRHTAGRLEETPQAPLAAIRWPEAPSAVADDIETSRSTALPASWPGGSTRIVGDLQGLSLEVTHARRRDAAGRLLLALAASESTPAGVRAVTFDRAHLGFQFYRTHQGPNETFIDPASPLVVEVPLVSDGKYHLVGAVETGGRTVAFECDVCVGDRRRCPAMRKRCQASFRH